MSHTAVDIKSASHLSVEKKTNDTFWNNVLGHDAEFNRFGIIPILLLVVSCLGGIAVYSGALLSTWQLIATVVPTMATLTFILAVAPMKLILNTGALASLISVILMTINFVS